LGGSVQVRKGCPDEPANTFESTSITSLGGAMQQFVQARRDLFLLLSLLLVILLYPLLDQGDAQRVVLGCLMFAPLLLATIKMTQIKGWVWPTFC
jgi:hypothetical protein